MSLRLHGIEGHQPKQNHWHFGIYVCGSAEPSLSRSPQRRGLLPSRGRVWIRLRGFLIWGPFQKSSRFCADSQMTAKPVLSLSVLDSPRALCLVLFMPHRFSNSRRAGSAVWVGACPWCCTTKARWGLVVRFLCSPTWVSQTLRKVRALVNVGGCGASGQCAAAINLLMRREIAAWL